MIPLFENALSQLPPFFRSRFFSLGALTLQLDFATPLLEEKLGKAFSHLEVPKQKPDLSISIWDTSAAKTTLPPLPWEQICQNGYRGFSQPPLYFHYFPSIGALSALDAESGRAYYIVRSGKDLPWWVSGSPLQALLHAWLREKGKQLTHAAAVGNGEKALLLTGKGGSGKSTVALACLEAGLSVLGEDYCALEPGKVESVYQSAKWEKHTRTLFSSYERYITNPQEADQEKALVYYGDLFPDRLQKSGALHAIVSLQIGKALSLKPARKGDAIRSLSMSTLSQLPFPDGRTLTLLQKTAASVPLYELTLGPDQRANGAFFQELLA